MAQRKRRRGVAVLVLALSISLFTIAPVVAGTPDDPTGTDAGDTLTNETDDGDSVTNETDEVTNTTDEVTDTVEGVVEDTTDNGSDTTDTTTDGGTTDSGTTDTSDASTDETTSSDTTSTDSNVTRSSDGESTSSSTEEADGTDDGTVIDSLNDTQEVVNGTLETTTDAVDGTVATTTDGVETTDSVETTTDTTNTTGSLSETPLLVPATIEDDTTRTAVAGALQSLEDDGDDTLDGTLAVTMEELTATTEVTTELALGAVPSALDEPSTSLTSESGDDDTALGAPAGDDTVQSADTGESGEWQSDADRVEASGAPPADTRLPGDTDTGAVPIPDGAGTGVALGLGALALGAIVRQSGVLAGTGAALTASTTPLTSRGSSALERLLRLFAPFRYSRYDDSDPLEHEARAEVFAVVEESPGAYLSELAERADLPLSTTRHHVRVLEREDLVMGAKVRGKRRFYPAYTEGIELAAAMNDAATASILDALVRLGAASVSDLADELDRDPSTISHHLQRLEEDDLIVREREGRAVMNRIAPEVRAAIEPDPEPVAGAGEALAGGAD